MTTGLRSLTGLRSDTGLCGGGLVSASGLRDAAAAAGGVLDNAVAYWKAVDYAGSGDLLDGSGNGHDAQFGSTAGADANDPLYLDRPNDETYLYMPGIAGNHLSVSDSGTFRPTGDISLRAHIYPDGLGTGELTLTDRMPSNNTGYKLRISADGTLRLFWNDGSLRAAASTAAIPTADKAEVYVRCDLDVDNGAGQYDVTFYTSTDGSIWNQLGSVVTGSSGTSSISYTGGEDFKFGQLQGATSPFKGRVLRVWGYSDLTESTLFHDIDLTDDAEYNATLTTVTEQVTAQNATINRATSDRPAVVVDRPLIVSGTDDYLEIAASTDFDVPTARDMTWVIVFRHHGQSTGGILASYNAIIGGSRQWVGEFIGAGEQLRHRLYDEAGDESNAQTAAGDAPSGTVLGFASVVDRTAATHEIYIDGVKEGEDTDISDIDDVTGNGAFYLMGRAGSNPTDCELFGAALFHEALSAADLNTVKTELLA